MSQHTYANIEIKAGDPALLVSPLLFDLRLTGQAQTNPPPGENAVNIIDWTATVDQGGTGRADGLGTNIFEAINVAAADPVKKASITLFFLENSQTLASAIAGDFTG